MSLIDCGYDQVFRSVYNHNYNPHWVNSFQHTNRNHCNINWYNTAGNKSSLYNYVYFKKQPYLECYLLDKEDFYGVSLKFKAKSNTLNLNSRTSSWAGSQTDGLCNLCNNNASEDIEHFMLSCNATDDLRTDEFHKLEQRLIERGLHAAWNLFNTGENDIKLCSGVIVPIFYPPSLMTKFTLLICSLTVCVKVF